MSDEPFSSLRVRWSIVATSSLVLACASLGTLVVVVAIKNVDLLSVVALALAIIAFSAQLIISLIQAQAAGQQLAAAERLNAETSGILKQMSAQYAALLATQSGQFDKVLDAALSPGVVREAVQAATADDSDSPFGNASIDADVLALALREAATRGMSDSTGGANFNPSQAFVDEMRSWPSEDEAREAILVVKALTALEAGLLMRRALTSFFRARDGLAPDVLSRPGGLGPVNQRLVDKGLVEYGGEPFRRRLTPLGRLAARILNVGGNPNPPDWVKSLSNE